MERQLLRGPLRRLHQQTPAAILPLLTLYLLFSSISTSTTKASPGLSIYVPIQADVSPRFVEDRRSTEGSTHGVSSTTQANGPGHTVTRSPLAADDRALPVLVQKSPSTESPCGITDVGEPLFYFEVNGGAFVAGCGSYTASQGYLKVPLAKLQSFFVVGQSGQVVEMHYEQETGLVHYSLSSQDESQSPQSPAAAAAAAAVSTCYSSSSSGSGSGSGFWGWDEGLAGGYDNCVGVGKQGTAVYTDNYYLSDDGHQNSVVVANIGGGGTDPALLDGRSISSNATTVAEESLSESSKDRSQEPSEPFFIWPSFMTRCSLRAALILTVSLMIGSIVDRGLPPPLPPRRARPTGLMCWVAAADGPVRRLCSRRRRFRPLGSGGGGAAAVTAAASLGGNRGAGGPMGDAATASGRSTHGIGRALPAAACTATSAATATTTLTAIATATQHNGYLYSTAAASAIAPKAIPAWRAPVASRGARLCIAPFTMIHRGAEQLVLCLSQRSIISISRVAANARAVLADAATAAVAAAAALPRVAAAAALLPGILRGGGGGSCLMQFGALNDKAAGGGGRVGQAPAAATTKAESGSVEVETAALSAPRRPRRRGRAAAAHAPAAAPAAATAATPSGPPDSGDAASADSQLCLVCLDAPRLHGFLHGASMHIGVCGDCTAEMMVLMQRRESPLLCPVCRDPVERMVAIFG